MATGIDGIGKPRGRPFPPGNPGRPKGARNRATLALEATFEGARERLTDTLIARALDGDMAAMRLCLARIAPPPRDVPIALDLDSVRDARETLEASRAVITAMAEGEVTPMEASRAMTVLVKHKTIVECELLEQRMTALEEHLKSLDQT